jgi:hypothetical protein
MLVAAEEDVFAGPNVGCIEAPHPVICWYYRRAQGIWR